MSKKSETIIKKTVIDFDLVILEGFNKKKYKSSLTFNTVIICIMLIAAAFLCIGLVKLFGKLFFYVCIAGLLFLLLLIYTFIDDSYKTRKYSKKLEEQSVWTCEDFMELTGKGKKDAIAEVSAAVNNAFDVNALCYKHVCINTKTKNTWDDPDFKEEEKKRKAALEREIKKNTFDFRISYQMEQIRLLNDELPNDVISRKLDTLEKNIEAIKREVMMHPENENSARKLVSYYLPTVTSLVQSFEQMEKNGIKTEASEKLKEQILEFLESTNAATRNLYEDMIERKALKSEAEISALNSMYDMDGLTDSDEFTDV